MATYSFVNYAFGFQYSVFSHSNFLIIVDMRTRFCAALLAMVIEIQTEMKKTEGRADGVGIDRVVWPEAVRHKQSTILAFSSFC